MEVNEYKALLGQKLKTLREEKGINRHNLHLAAEISQHGVINIEESKTCYTIDTLLKYMLAADMENILSELLISLDADAAKIAFSRRSDANSNTAKFKKPL